MRLSCLWLSKVRREPREIPEAELQDPVLVEPHLGRTPFASMRSRFFFGCGEVGRGGEGEGQPPYCCKVLAPVGPHGQGPL